MFAPRKFGIGGGSMSHLLETFGRGLLGRLAEAFPNRLPHTDDADAAALARQRQYASTSADLAIRTGTAYLYENRWTDARRSFEYARQIPEARTNATVGLACVLDDLGRTAESLALLESIQSAEPDDAAIPFAAGLSHERAGRIELARDAYLRSIELCPRLRNSRERLAAIAVRECDWREAARHYEQLARSAPEDPSLTLTLAELRLQEGNHQSAMRYFQQALLVEPETSTEALDEIEELQNAGELSKAIGRLEGLVSKYPGVSEFHVHLGDLYVKAGKDDAAIRHYRMAVEIHPAFLEANVKLGTQHLRAGRLADAARTFTDSVELNDRLLVAFVGLSLAQCGDGKPADAMESLNLAVGLVPNSVLLLTESTRLQLKAGRLPQFDFDTAEASADAALLAPPDEDELILRVIHRCEQLILHNPLRSDIHYRYAVLLRQSGETSQSLSALRRAVAVTPAFAKAQILLGLSLHEAGRRVEALAALQSALLARSADLEMHYQLGLLFSNRTQFDLIAEQLESKAQSPRDVQTIQSHLMLALQHIGMLNAAEYACTTLAEIAATDGPRLASRFRNAQ